MRKGLALLLIAAAAVAPACAAQKSATFGRFGKVEIFAPSTTTRHVVIFVSGNDGWTPRMTRLSRELAVPETFVIGVDAVHYLRAIRTTREKCSFPAADFVELSQALQKQNGIAPYISPVLVGFNAGATLVYGTLAQAKTDTFAGAISLGFCPTLFIDKPFCKGQGLEQEALPENAGYKFLPVKTLEDPWVTMEGAEDSVCDPKLIDLFVKDVPHGDISLLTGVGHDFADEPKWLPALKRAIGRMEAESDVTPPSEHDSTRGLPLIEIPGKGEQRDVFAVLISGDGGWAGIDRELARTFSDAGVDVVGLNSLRYFWKRKEPDDMGRDLERILRHYFEAWHKSKVILVGYSRGADVLPFMASRLPKDLTDKTSLVALLGLETTVEFELHPGDIFNMKGKHEVAVTPELEKLKGLKIACFHGSDETDSLCHSLPADLAESIELKGGHHFGGDYKSIALQILDRTK